MEVKKDYQVNDSAWIHGIARDNRLVQGKVIKKFTMDYDGYDDENYYVIAVPTEIEPLLEIRTWHNISQDARGPIGVYRNMDTKDILDKFIKKVGYSSSDELEDLDEPTAEEIHAAILKSQQTVTHGPLHIKENKPKRRNYHRKKKA